MKQTHKGKEDSWGEKMLKLGQIGWKQLRALKKRISESRCANLIETDDRRLQPKEDLQSSYVSALTLLLIA